MPQRRTRMRVEELASFLSVDQVTLLCDLAGGRRIPKPGQVDAWKRRVLLVNDWLRGGYRPRDLAAKYGMSESAVKRLLTIARRQKILAELRAEAPGQRWR